MSKRICAAWLAATPQSAAGPLSAVDVPITTSSSVTPWAITPALKTRQANPTVILFSLFMFFTPIFIVNNYSFVIITIPASYYLHKYAE
jgi:hypothetical protein